MVPGGFQWFFMIPGWFFVVPVRLFIVSGCLLCFFPDSRLAFHSSRSGLVFHGSRSVFMACQGSRLVFHGSRSISMGFQGRGENCYLSVLKFIFT